MDQYVPCNNSFIFAIFIIPPPSMRPWLSCACTPPKLALNLQSSYSDLQSMGITGVCHQTKNFYSSSTKYFIIYLFWIVRLCSPVGLNLISWLKQSFCSASTAAKITDTVSASLATLRHSSFLFFSLCFFQFSLDISLHLILSPLLEYSSYIKNFFC